MAGRSRPVSTGPGRRAGARRVRRGALTLALLALAAVAAAQPGDPARAMVQAVLDQLAAFRRGDWAGAYAFASSAIRARFGPEAFRVMVTQGYAAIAHSTRATVGRVEALDAQRGLVEVRVDGANGETIDALYELVEEQGTWRVNGVVTRPVEQGPTASLARVPGHDARMHAPRAGWNGARSSRVREAVRAPEPRVGRAAREVAARRRLEGTTGRPAAAGSATIPSAPPAPRPGRPGGRRHRWRAAASTDRRRRPTTEGRRRHMGTLASRSARPFAIALILAMLLATPALARVEKVGKGEGAVDIVAWPGYIERGATDKNFDWVTDFEKKTGCKVRVKTANTSDEMVALMNEGGFDLVTASGDASLRLVAGGRVQEVNVALVPSYKTVDPRLQKAPWHHVKGKHYGVPYQWGYNVLAYNTEVFKAAPPKSWEIVFKEATLPDGKSNKGRVQAFDGPIYIADAALYLMHARPELGIKNPYELDDKQYKAALELLREQRKIVSRYWHDAFVQIDDFTNEGVVASSSWGFQVNLLRSKNRPIASVVPQEGATGWADTTMMHVRAPHPNCSYMWLEHSINPKLQGDLAAWFGSVPAVPAACKGNKLLGDKGCEQNGFNEFDRIWFWRTPVADCGGGRACVPYYRWVTDYIAILGGR